jgi:uncharacterized cupredoxin-like copper-binding protein
MKSKKMLIGLAIAILIIPVLTACGPTKVDAALTTYKITLDKDSAPAGDIIFHVHNDATDLTHEFVIFKTDLAPDSLPTKDDGTVDEEGQGVTHIDEVELEPGASQDLTVNLDSGNYVLICNIDSNEMHYAHGMHVAFTVK